MGRFIEERLVKVKLSWLFTRQKSHRTKESPGRTDQEAVEIRAVVASLLLFAEEEVSGFSRNN